MAENDFCVNCSVLENEITELKTENSLLRDYNRFLEKELQNWEKRTFLNRLKCLFGFHDWEESDLRSRRDCIICGKREKREPLAPDGFLGPWEKWYED